MGLNWWVENAYNAGGASLLLGWIFWVIFSITLHELAHGVVAIWNGDQTPRELGHMTANPVVHMGWMSLLFFAISGIAWGMMPTDPSRYRNERFGQFTVAIAGPVTNLILAFLCLTGMGVFLWLIETGRAQPSLDLADNLTNFLWNGGWLNLVLAVFNMLPVPPLDGSKVLGAVFDPIDRWFKSPEVQQYGLIAMLFIFFVVGFKPLQQKLQVASDNYASWTASKLVQQFPRQ